MQIFYHRKENSLIHLLLGCFIMVKWTEWSAIWAKIIHVNSKSKCTMQVRFEITSMISDQNCTTQGSTTTLLHPFWNCPNTGLDQFKYFINAALSWFEIKFIHFLGGKRGLETKVAKFVIWYSLSFISCNLIQVTLNKPWNLIGCYVFSVACSLAGKKMRFKAKNSAISE